MSNKSLILALLVLLVSCHLNCEARLEPKTRHGNETRVHGGFPQRLLTGEVWSEMEVALSADKVWAYYSSPDLPRLIVKLMPSYFQSIDVIQGDGRVGTVLNITLQPSIQGPKAWLEEFIKIDHVTRTKVVRQIGGGHLDIGFTQYEDIFQIIPTGDESCFIRSTVSLIVKDGFESGVSYISPSWDMPKAIVNYIHDKKAKMLRADSPHGNETQVQGRSIFTVMPGKVWSEIEVDLSASEVWAYYSSPGLPVIVANIMSSYFRSIDIIQGNGGVGTVLDISLQPSIPGPKAWLEKFIKIDRKTHTKIVREIKGGYLDIGFTLYKDIFQIIPTGRTCVIRSTVSFSVQDGFESGASYITPSWDMPKAIVNYIYEKKAKDLEANNLLASKTGDS